MAGYDGYSMSNNAREAYDNGEMPISKWTKTAILEAIEEQGYNADILKKYPANALKSALLKQTSWHHTSAKYNRIDFYSVDFDRLEPEKIEYTLERLKNCVENQAKAKEKEQPKVEKIYKAEFYIWKRGHINGTEILTGKSTDDKWLIDDNGNRHNMLAGKCKSYKQIDRAELAKITADNQKIRDKESLFYYQKKYKTLNGFIKSEKVNYSEIKKTIEARIKQLEAAKCTSYTMIEAKKALEVVNEFIKEECVSYKKITSKLKATRKAQNARGI